MELCEHLSLELEAIASWVDFHVFHDPYCTNLEKILHDDRGWGIASLSYEVTYIFPLQATEDKSNIWNKDLCENPQKGERYKMPQFIPGSVQLCWDKTSLGPMR